VVVASEVGFWKSDPKIRLTYPRYLSMTESIRGADTVIPEQAQVVHKFAIANRHAMWASRRLAALTMSCRS
jgi:hypothetical protein